MTCSSNYFLYSGAGNLFAIVERVISSAEAVAICKESLADGVLVLKNKSELAIFNCDGSQASCCGNGLRCIAAYLCGGKNQRKTIGMRSGSYEVWMDDEGQACVKFPLPKNIIWNLKIDKTLAHYLNTGVAHLVTFVEDIENIDLNKIGVYFSSHPSLPSRANVDIVNLKSNHLYIRTFELGVEGETLSCGTGSVAAAYVAKNLYKIPSPIILHARSGDLLKAIFTPDEENIILSGPAVPKY